MSFGLYVVALHRRPSAATIFRPFQVRFDDELGEQFLLISLPFLGSCLFTHIIVLNRKDREGQEKVAESVNMIGKQFVISIRVTLRSLRLSMLVCFESRALALISETLLIAYFT